MTTLLTMKGFNKQATPITTAGIYHSPSLGLISLSSDGTNWITIADKNLGATQVYNDGDTLSEANCGKYYQWGNNYGFPFTGAVTTSSIKVNASNYGPGNYYNSSTFIKVTISPYDWSSVQNDNLRGNTTDTNIARQGPCANEFHVPSNGDGSTLISIFNTIVSSSSSAYIKYLLLPPAGYLNYDAGKAQLNSTASFWTCAVRSSTNFAWALHAVKNTQVSYPTYDGKCYALPIRPFANTPVQPDDSWTVLYPTN